MGGGLSVCNQVDFPIHVGLSLLSPVYHELYLQPGRCKKWKNIGIVFFTINVYAANLENEQYVDDHAAVSQGILAGIGVAAIPLGFVGGFVGAGAGIAGGGIAAKDWFLEQEGLLASKKGAYANRNEYDVRYKYRDKKGEGLKIVFDRDWPRGY